MSAGLIKVASGTIPTLPSVTLTLRASTTSPASKLLGSRVSTQPSSLSFLLLSLSRRFASGKMLVCEFDEGMVDFLVLDVLSEVMRESAARPGRWFPGHTIEFVAA